LILLVITSLLSLLDFENLVAIEFFCYSFSYIVFIVAFLFFRQRVPFESRPEGAWQVPYGNNFAIAISIPTLLLFAFLIGASFTDWRMLVGWIGVTLIACVMNLYLGKNRTREQILALKRLLSGDEYEGRLEDVDLRATEMCPFPWQRYEYQDDEEEQNVGESGNSVEMR
jgi:amino acid transporter